MYQDDVSEYPRAYRRRSFKLLPIVLFALYGIYFYFSNRQTVPITGRHQVVHLSREQEISLGLQAYREVLSQQRVVSSGPEVNTIRDIGARISKAAAVSDFKWEFNLVDTPEANAFCLPGGKVVVNSGILPITANQDGLAIVMGHEIAHAIARHGAERMAQQQLLEFGRMAVGMAVQDMDQTARQTVLGVFGVGSQFGILLPFSRTHESEADKIGLLLAARACFNPEEAPRFWERMARASDSGRPPTFMSTHPSPERRVEQLKAWMPEALAERAKYCGGGEAPSIPPVQ